MIMRLSSICLIFMLIAGCYSADGFYEAKGVVLKSHALKLDMPEFKPGSTKAYEIEGFYFGDRTPSLKLYLLSEEPLPYWGMNAEVGITVSSVKTGDIVYRVSGTLNSYYEEVIVRSKRISDPRPYWRAAYTYPGNDWVAFHPSGVLPGSVPVKQRNILFYRVDFPDLSWKEKYKVEIKIVSCPDMYAHVSGVLSLELGAL